MNLDQIQKALTERFQEPCRDGAKRHIIFWYDDEGDFAELINELELSDVKLWKLTESNKFISKYTFEVLDPDSNYLVYAPFAQPEDQENGLLDIQLYSRMFTADKIAMIMDDFKVENPSLRASFKKNEKFFQNKERYVRFASYAIEDLSEETLSIGILAALAKQPTPDFEDAVRAILMNSLQEEENTLWQSIIKFGDPDVFWNLNEKFYGYLSSEKSLKGLFTFFVINTISHVLERPIPHEWKSFISTKQANCVLFLNHFMHDRTDAKIYDKLSTEIEPDLHFEDFLEQWELQEYTRVDLFQIFDRTILRKMINSLLIGSEEFEKYQGIISSRKATHFYPQFENYYEALFWGIEMFSFKKRYGSGMPVCEAKDFMEAYAQDYYRMDKAYRKFCLYCEKEWHSDILKPLSDELENLYTHWFHTELAVKWSEVISEEHQKSWPIYGIKHQWNFYRDVIQKDYSNHKRTFVIISDALRFEAAEELTERLNQSVKGSTDLDWMLGCVPSYTRLGMAALLPHTTLTFQEGDILADGMSTIDSSARKAVLQASCPSSEVIQLNHLLPMTRTELRNCFKGKDVVYIYHDVIDKTGDKGDETKTFQAVEQALEEIIGAITKINKELTEANIYITSDHGFIYRRKPLEESDKTTKGDSVPLYTNKRFLIFDKAIDLPGTIDLSLDYLFGQDCGLVVSVPRGDNRFKMPGGGQNYVHGGASLQEIVIPLIHYKNDRKKDEHKRVSKVDVRLINTMHRITNSIFSLDFFQTEIVADKKGPRSLNIYFTDESGQTISSVKSLLADCTSEKPGERTFKLSFNLKGRSYSSTDKYYLVLEDPAEPVQKIYERIPFTISLGIVNDFDF